MVYIIKSSKTGDVRNKIYTSKRGASLGKRAVVLGILQNEYLANGKYHVYLTCIGYATGGGLKCRPVTSRDRAEFAKRKAELEEEWEILEREMKDF